MRPVGIFSFILFSFFSLPIEAKTGLQIVCTLPTGPAKEFPSDGILNLGFVEGKVSCTLGLETGKKQHKENPPSKRQYLVFLWSHLDRVEVCYGLVCQTSGYQIPQKDKGVPSPFPSFVLEELPVQLNLKSKNYISPEIVLLEEADFLRFLTKYTAVIFSLFLLVGLYSLSIFVLWFVYRQTWLLAFGCFLLGWTLTIPLLSGYVHMAVFPDLTFSLATAKKLMVAYLETTGILWILSYFRLRERNPFWAKFYYCLLVCIGLTIIAIWSPVPRKWLSLIFHTIYLTATLSAIYLALIKVSDALKPSPWLLGSLLSLFLWEILNIFAYDHLDLHDSQIYLVLILVSFLFQIYFSLQTVRDTKVESWDEVSQQPSPRATEEENLVSLAEKKSYLKGLDKAQIEKNLIQLLNVDKVYLEEGLRLGDLAIRLNLSSHQLSEFLNQHMGVSFVDLVKKYRIEEAKKMMEENPRKNILQIAYESGFVSKSVFNDAFRKATQMSPIEYRRELLHRDFQK